MITWKYLHATLKVKKYTALLLRDVTKEDYKINKELVNTPGEKQKKIQIANKYMK